MVCITRKFQILASCRRFPTLAHSKESCCFLLELGLSSNPSQVNQLSWMAVPNAKSVCFKGSHMFTYFKHFLGKYVTLPIFTYHYLFHFRLPIYPVCLQAFPLKFAHSAPECLWPKHPSAPLPKIPGRFQICRRQSPPSPHTVFATPAGDWQVVASRPNRTDHGLETVRS